MQIKFRLCVFGATMFLFLGCVTNVEEKSREVTLSGSAAGLKGISVEEKLIKDAGITLTGIDSSSIVMKTVARMLSLKNDDPDFSCLQLSISPDGLIGFTCAGVEWSAIRLDKFTLHAYKKLAVSFKTGSGDIEVGGMQGSCHLESSSGGVGIVMGYDSLKDTVDYFIKTVSGDISILLPEDTLAFVKNSFLVTLESTSGDILLKVPKGFTARLDFETKSGEKNITPSFKDSVSSHNRISCTTKSGDLTILAY